MSTILITEHNENIYNLIKHKPCKPAPKVVDKSNHIKELLAQEKQLLQKFPHKTMGYAEVPLAKPTEFLRKHNGVQRPRAVVDYEEHYKEAQCHRRSGLRRTSQKKFKTTDTNKPEAHMETQASDAGDKQPLEGIECICKPMTMPADTKKVPHLVLGKKSHAYNFIRKNRTYVKGLVPKQPKHCYIDTNKGAIHELKPSGLELNYTLKKTYGKLPHYLSLQKEHQQEIEKEIKEEAQRKKPKGRYITQPERMALLEGLKHNWAELQKQYLLLPIIIDTIPKKMRKLKLEKELKELEKDIKTIEEHPYIFVTDADVPEFTYEPENEE